MQITDIHAHVFPDPIAGKASGSIGAFYQMPVRLEGTVGQLLEEEQKAGIGHACIHSVALTPHYVDSINRFIADTVKQHPGCLTGFGAIHPDCEDIPGLIREIKGMGLKDAIYLLENQGYKVKFKGHGKVVSQTPRAGADLPKGETVTLSLDS